MFIKEKVNKKFSSTSNGFQWSRPDKIMFNVHPQRWHDRPWPWLKSPVKFAYAGLRAPVKQKEPG